MTEKAMANHVMTDHTIENVSISSAGSVEHNASEILARSREIRNDPAIHYNCAQGVFIPFAEKKGMPFDAAKAMTANFGGGMRVGATCGAITGGLMALGLYGADDSKDAAEFVRRMKEKHGNRIDCRDLLREEVHSPAEKKPHCDNMVYEAVEIVEDMLKERNLKA
ncbi:MAG: C-GCAxxG-C-C family protein [Lachnospiraceae bacterium]|nr:C-GCAxxG-C-C family protein [Lachnospiraceae bacterium]MDD6578792.1 C-GCAxxG-C-C family protein [Lachnospiraceae bacterium]